MFNIYKVVRQLEHLLIGKHFSLDEILQTAKGIGVWGGNRVYVNLKTISAFYVLVEITMNNFLKVTDYLWCSRRKQIVTFRRIIVRERALNEISNGPFRKF